ncbi:bicaudal D-related protein homolog [Chrysoperla carnea]|uniref:bicaudal D-related protein homolog n=1 Tax=Chrysoperla carnea TaxID=189513 RepID=UPI001D06339F|nr:bicaudal D-related protein homolog [Chrysoperla carnea]
MLPQMSKSLNSGSDATECIMNERIPDGISVEDIWSQLQQKEADLILAAELGKALLEQKEELQRQHDVTIEEVTKKLEQVEQDRHLIKRKLTTVESDYEARILELQNDLKELNERYDTREVNYKRWERDQNALVQELNAQNQRLTAQLNDAKQLENQLTAQLEQLREQSTLRKVSLSEQASSLDALRDELHLANSQRQELEKRLIAFANERESLTATLEEAEDRILALERHRREQDAQLQLVRRELDHTRLLGKISEPISAPTMVTNGPRSILAEMECDEAGADWRAVYRQLRELCQQLKSQREDDDSGMHSDCSSASLDGDRPGGAAVLVEVGQELVRLVLDTDTVRLLERLESARREIRERDDELCRRADTIHELESRVSVKEVELQAAIEERDRARTDVSQSSLARDDVVQQAREVRDAAVARRNKAEVELARTRVDLMQANSQLLEAIQQKIELSQQLDQWQMDMQELIDEQMRNKLKESRTRQITEPPQAPERTKRSSRLLNLFNR